MLSNNMTKVSLFIWPSHIERSTSFYNVHSVPGIIKEYILSTEPGWKDAENNQAENPGETENNRGAETGCEHTEGERWLFSLHSFKCTIVLKFWSVRFFKEIYIFIQQRCIQLN